MTTDGLPSISRQMRAGTIAALVACLGTAVLVLRNGLIEAGYRSNPAAMAGIGASDARVRGQLITNRIEQAKMRVSPRLLDDARALLRSSPMNESALVVAGGMSLQAGRLAEAQARLEEARRRGPRNRFAHLYLLETYLRAMKLPQAGVEIATLTRLLGDSRRILVPVVAQAMINPVVGPPLKSAVLGDTELRSSVALAMVGLGATPAQIIGVGGTKPTSDPIDRAWRAALLQKMVDSGQIDVAYRLWRSFSSVARNDASVSFLPADGLPPFAWTYLGTGDGVAEPSSHGALDISFYNRNSVSLARKLITLAPGTWRIDIAVEGGATRGTESLALQVICAGVTTPLARIPFNIGTGGAMRAFATFTVPTACHGQWLSIDGTAQDLPTPRTVSVTGLTLKSVT